MSRKTTFEEPGASARIVPLAALFGVDLSGVEPRSIEALVRLSELASLSERGEHHRVLKRVEELLASLDAGVDDTLDTARASIASFGGNSSMQLRRPEDALRFAEIELAAADAVSDGATLRARGLNVRAIAKEELGRLAEATKDYEEALGVLDTVPKEPGVESMRRLIAYHLAHLRTTRDEPTEGMSELVLDAALAHNAPGPLRASEQAALNARAWAASMRGDHERALAVLEQARRDHADADDRMAGVFASNIGMEHLACGRPDDALRELRLARELHATGNHRAELAMDCFNLGVILRDRGEVEEAAGYLVEAWNAMREASIRSMTTVKVLSALATVRMIQRDHRRARAAAEKALDIYEGLRPQLAEEEAEHAGPLAVYRFVLEVLLYLALHEGWFSDAVALVERGKGRFWYEEVARRRTSAGARGSETGLGLHPAASDWRGGWERQLREVCGPDTIILSYLSGPDTTFRIAGFNGRSQMRRLDVDMQRLTQLVDEARYDCMASRSRRRAPREAIAGLSELLLGGVTLPFGKARLIVVLPDGPLWSAPFDALAAPQTAETVLADVAPLVVAPSLQILEDLEHRARADGAGRRVVVVADPEVADMPPLPGARLQLDAVVQAFGRRDKVTPLAGAEATKERTLDAIGGATHIHFATHALTHGDDERTCLVLSDGQGSADPLYTEEVQRLDLNAEVVFLSACGTSIGRASTGEGMASLARACLFAGARCGISTLWPVPDLEAAGVTRDFYAALAGDAPVARALHTARVAARDSGASARTWASLQVVGGADSMEERAYWGLAEAQAWQS